MKQKIISLEYQRNGVAGEPFFALTLQNLKDQNGTFLITFQADENTQIVDYSNCRVVMIAGFENAAYCGWRGDRIAGELTDLLKNECEKANVKDIYDLHVHLENKATGRNLPITYKDKN